MGDKRDLYLEVAHIEDSIEAGQRAYKASATMTVPQLAGWVLEALGQRVTAAALGLSDARPVREWQQGGKIKEENEERLRLLYRVGWTITLVYDEQTARAFLRSASPYLDDSAPVLAIARGDERAVLEALRSFLEG